MITKIISFFASGKVKAVLIGVLAALFLTICIAAAFYRLEVKRLEAQLESADILQAAQLQTIKAQAKNIELIKAHQTRLSQISKDSGKIIERIETIREVPGKCKHDEDFKSIYSDIADRFNGVQQQDNSGTILDILSTTHEACTDEICK